MGRKRTLADSRQADVQPTGSGSDPLNVSYRWLADLPAPALRLFEAVPYARGSAGQ